ncbi:MAG: M56 family metallopeptidase [Verrucomicrobiia bacterium]
MNATQELERQLNWLLNHSLQAGVLVLLVLGVQWLFRRRLTSRWRFALWWIVLARLLLPFSPQSAVSLFNYFRPVVQLEGSRYAAPVPPLVAGNSSLRIPPPIILPTQSELPQTENQPATPPAPAAANSPEQIQTAPATAVPKHSLSFDDFLIPGLAGLWLAGVLILSGAVVVQMIRFYRELASATAPAGSNLQALLDDCRHEFGLSRRVELLETAAVESPALFGLLRLQLLVPRGFGGQFAGRELRYIFLHELAHVKRGDLWLNWLVTALQILHWFNPLLWLGFARLRADRELACDELALLRAGDNVGTAYGETVVKLLENSSRPAAIPGLVGILEDKKQMRRRISMIANFRRPGKWSALAVILIAGIAAAALTDAQTDKSAFANASRPDLTGAVTAKGGRTLPVPANVFIATAAPKNGTSTFCPSCYADCAKHSRTDAQGNFKIESLNPQLTFQILAVAKGYQPKSISKVDPAKGPVKIELEPLSSADATPHRSLRGRVVDMKGDPVAGAVVEMVGTETKDGGGSWGALPGIDPLAVTDDNGEFLITSKKPFEMMDVNISARTFADKNFSKLPSSKENALVMTEGATIKGRVLRDGSPLKGVSVGISGVERQAGVYIGHFEVGTDADGRFVFINIPPDVDFWIYTAMSSMKKFGAAPIQEIHSGKDRETTDVGDLVAAPAHRLAGRVVLAAGAPLPPEVRLLISRQDAWDSMQITLDADGNFDTTGVPPELISLSARVKGYHVSARNLSVDQLNPFQLIGRVDHDITNLVFVLEKGPEPQPDYNHIDPEYNGIRLRPLQGAEGVVEHSRDWTISGHVTDADMKQPVQNFRVTPGHMDQFGMGWSTLRGMDGSNGVYSAYVSKRTAQPMLKVEADGYLPAAIELQSRDATNVDFVLKRGTGPEGTVTTPDSKPAAATALVLLNEEMNQAGFNPGGALTAYGNRTALRTADANGHFSFKPILGMKFVAAASSNGFAIVSVQSLATNSTITLEPYGKIIGTLKRTSGPGTNEILDVTLADERPAGLNMWLPADTDEQGHFQFDHVPAGHLQISYRLPMGGNGWQDRLLKEVDLKPGQTLEVNISAADRPAENERNSYQPPPLTPVPGEHLKGIVLAPDGKPAANAEVALQLREGPFNLSLGRGFLLSSGLREKGLHVNADADGRFDLPLYEKAIAVVAVNEEGFAQVSLDEFKNSPQIQLQIFGRVDGTLRIGHHAGTNETVDLSPAVPHNRVTELTNPAPKFLQPLMYDSQAFSARTDENGKFAIGFVPPGERSLWRRIPYGERGWTQSQLATVEVKPGQTVVTNIGGNGRTVTGKVQFSGDFPVDFKNGMGIITSPTFKIYEKFRQLKTDAERKAFLASPEAEALRAEERSFSVRVATDGSFRTEDVLPGNYEFVFQPSVKLDEKSRTWAQLASAREFTVPSAKDENDDSTVELGTIDLKKRELPIPRTDAEKK